MVRYRQMRLLGRSRHAEVWQAEHAPSGAHVALKTTTRDATSLHNEARMTARLHHPGVVQVLDMGVRDGQAFVVQELAERGPVPDQAADDWASALATLTDVLHALAHAHARGLIHRDLKPSNLLRFDEAPHVRLADFGIATTARDAAATISGTPAFCAPEQLRGDALRPATDLYAVGCIGWLLVTGQPPFDGDEDTLEFAHQFSPLPALKAAFDVPDGLQGWLASLLEKDALDRPRLAADALRRLAELGPLPPPPPARRRARPAGLELGALREPPVAGRHAQKRLLHARLASLDGPDEVVLTGPAGCGKTALAEWLATWAHETGRAVTARSDAGLASLVRDTLRLEGARGDDVGRRVDQAIDESDHLHPLDRPLLLAVLTGRELPGGEADALTRRLLRHAAGDRALVWLVEDSGLDCDVDAPILIVRTSRQPVPGGLALAPLSDEDAADLLSDVGPLTDAEVSRLVERGAGNAQLLSLLAQDPVLPASLSAAWSARVRAICPDTEPLAVAALLDHPRIEAMRVALAPHLLDRADALLRIGNPSPAEALLSELEDLRLAPDDRSAWHRLHAALATWRKQPATGHAERAVETARGPAARCRALIQLASTSDADTALALRSEARALAVQNGLQDLAVEALVAEATSLVRQGRTDDAVTRLAAVERLLPDPSAPEAYRVPFLAAWLALKQARFHDAIGLAVTAREGAWALGKRLAAYHALTYEGDARRLLGDLEGASECFARAIEITDAMGTQSGAIARLNQAILFLHQGRTADARPVLERAVAEFESQQRAAVELSGRFWLFCCVDGPERDACLARIRSLLERTPGRDPDVLEAATFALQATDDARLVPLVERVRPT